MGLSQLKLLVAGKTPNSMLDSTFPSSITSTLGPEEASNRLQQPHNHTGPISATSEKRKLSIGMVAVLVDSGTFGQTMAMQNLMQRRDSEKWSARGWGIRSHAVCHEMINVQPTVEQHGQVHLEQRTLCTT
jgi:hypothetical protein